MQKVRIFPPQITPESIKEPHESYPYNLKITKALYKSTYLESWGSGAKRIMDACREQGVEEPSWRWDGGFIIVTFKRPEHELSTTQLGNQLGTNKEPVWNQLETSSSQVKLLIDKMEESFYSVKDSPSLFVDLHPSDNAHAVRTATKNPPLWGRVLGL